MITRIAVNENNRQNILNYIKINHPNYVLIDNYEVEDRGSVFTSDKAEVNQGLQGPTVVIEMEGDVKIKIRKDDYQKKGSKLIPVFLTENDIVDNYSIYSELLREVRTVSPAQPVASFKNFEIRGNQVHVRDNNIRSGETIFIVR